jgi:tripartite-type tricarboxylate transporter receptor subunit TctC
MTPKIATPQELAARIAAELAQWTAVAKAAGISID